MPGHSNIHKSCQIHAHSPTYKTKNINGIFLIVQQRRLLNTVPDISHISKFTIISLLDIKRDALFVVVIGLYPE